MRFVCQQEDLLKGLSVTQKAINTHNTLPVLSNILIESEGQKVKLSATNLEISIQTSIQADVKNEGKITIPARILTSWVSFLKKSEIEIKTKENETLLLKTNEAKTTIKGISAEEFPVLLKIEKENEFTLKNTDLKKAINEVIFSCSHSSIRPVLSGVLITGKNNEIRFAATDSYRLSEKIVNIDKKLDKEIYCIIPARTMIEVERIISSIKEDKDVKVIISQNQILFQIENISITSRLIDGKFPEYNQIIPKNNKTKIIIKKDDLVLAIKRVGIFAKENNNNMRFIFEKEKVIITTDVTEIGTEEAELEINLTGEPSQASLNGQFLLDILSVIEEDEIEIGATEKLAPIIIKGKNQEGFTHVIMPLKL